VKGYKYPTRHCNVSEIGSQEGRKRSSLKFLCP